MGWMEFNQITCVDGIKKDRVVENEGGAYHLSSGHTNGLDVEFPVAHVE